MKTFDWFDVVMFLGVAVFLLGISLAIALKVTAEKQLEERAKQLCSPYQVDYKNVDRENKKDIIICLDKDGNRVVK